MRQMPRLRLPSLTLESKGWRMGEGEEDGKEGHHLYKLFLFILKLSW